MFNNYITGEKLALESKCNFASIEVAAHLLPISFSVYFKVIFILIYTGQTVLNQVWCLQVLSLNDKRRR